ncbi:DUF6765 family protein [Pseudomonadota bacterium]
MDQDFHYYGAYYAARVGGKFSNEDATRIARASNFIDFMSNGNYAGYWDIVRENYTRVAEVTYPRYTFQGTFSVAAEGSGGLWASFHFPPGNYPDPEGTPSDRDVHGQMVAEMLPGHQVRDVCIDASLNIDANIAKLLNRPQSALSKALIQDTLRCMKDPDRLEKIIACAKGGKELLAEKDKADVLQRFKLLLLGARSHVIADTWAHQDWSAVNNKINTYWNIEKSLINDQFYQQMEYQKVDGEWSRVHLSWTADENFQAAPNQTSYVGHGWMGHFPDYSFVKYRYKPCWRNYDAEPFERDNPTQYTHAFLELCSLFSQANGSEFAPHLVEKEMAAATKAISSPCDITMAALFPRVYSAEQWKNEMTAVGIEAPSLLLDTKVENHTNDIMPGLLGHKPGDPLDISREGRYYVDYNSDLYLFHIAADYHFQFAKYWLNKHNIGTDLYADNWSQQEGPVSAAEIKTLFD